MLLCNLIFGSRPHPVSNRSVRVCARDLWVVVWVCLQPAWAPQQSLAQEAGARPNLLFVFTDDQAQSCVGCLGNPHIQTPNLDQLAAEGVLFRNAFVTTAICCSNRACILTGQYMRRHGIEDFKQPLSEAAMGQSYAVLLQDSGYRTGFLGKFAVGRDAEEVRSLSLPAHRFDFWYGFPQSINFLQEDAAGKHYLTTRMEEEAVKFIQSQPKDRPFCLTVALKEPHGPTNYFDPDVEDIYADALIPPPSTFTQQHYDALPKFIQQSLAGAGGLDRLQDPQKLLQQMRTAYRLITRADLALGRLREALRVAGLDRNTIIIYTSDHGSFLGAHGLTGKWLMHEESIRVPLVIYDPRRAVRAQPQQSDEMVLSIDLAPTMLELAGVAVPPSMQGQSMVPLLHGTNADWRSDWYYEHSYANPPQHAIPKSVGVRSKDWKYVRYTDFQPPVEQLFHLSVDPREERDLASDPSYQERLSQLRQRCDQYQQELR
jgi:arylsulfatase A-like enzyme